MGGNFPVQVSESFANAAKKVVQFLEEMSTPVDLNDRESLLRAASTSLNSKVSRQLSVSYREQLYTGANVHTIFRTQIVSQYSSILAPIAVDGVKRLATNSSTNVDLRDIRIVKKVGGTIDDTELVDGVALNQNVNTAAGGPTRIEKAKIGLIQFQLSAPKPDVSGHFLVAKS